MSRINLVTREGQACVTDLAGHVAQLGWQTIDGSWCRIRLDFCRKVGGGNETSAGERPPRRRILDTEGRA